MLGLLVEHPVLAQLASGPKRPPPEEGLRLGEAAARPPGVRAVATEVPSGAVDHAGRDGQTFPQVPVVPKPVPVVETSRAQSSMGARPTCRTQPLRDPPRWDLAAGVLIDVEVRHEAAPQLVPGRAPAARLVQTA